MQKTHYKTAEQIEFAELFERIEKLGYTRADVSRELHLTRPAITNYLKCTSSPSARTLEGLKVFLKRIEDAKPQAEKSDRKFGSLDAEICNDR